MEQVPLLTPATIKWVKPNTLVRFRGMIQDMLGNEFYIGAYKVFFFFLFSIEFLISRLVILRIKI